MSTIFKHCNRSLFYRKKTVNHKRWMEHKAQCQKPAIRFATDECPDKTQPSAMDLLPQPCGCWFEADKKRQILYNRLLGFGIFMTGLGIAMCAATVDFNFDPTKSIELTPEDFNN